MNSISIRFALTAAAGAFFILALIGMVNYHFLKEALLHDATEKAQLIEKNSIHRIETILKQTRETSHESKTRLLEEGFDKKKIREVLVESITEEPYFFGMAMAFEPHGIYDEPFSPYYYKHNGSIAYKDITTKDNPYFLQEWYLSPKKSQKAKWSEPYFDQIGAKILMATYGNPIMIDGVFKGVITIDLSLEQLEEVISSIHILQSGYAFLLSKAYKILVHPDSKKIMQTYHKTSEIIFDKIIKEEDQWIYYAQVGNTGLILGVVLPEEELFVTLNKISLISILLAASGSILLIIIMLLISQRITRPLKEVTKVTSEISQGNFDKKISLPKEKDEIYDLALSVNRMQDAIKHFIEDLRTATIKEERVESELSIARDIQMSMLPKEIENNPYVEIDCFLKPAKAVGGDFYDFFMLDEDHLCFVIADVSGKGVPAAMFMSVTMSYIRAYSTSKKHPASIVNKLNDTIAPNNDANMFVTLFLAVLDVKNGKMRYVNAGHTEPCIITAENTLKILPSSHNPVAGAFEGVDYREVETTLKRDEKIFLYTDGITEAFSEKDEPFGEERLKHVLTAKQGISGRHLIDTLYHTITDFSKGCEQSDDITMLVVGRK